MILASTVTETELNFRGPTEIRVGSKNICINQNLRGRASNKSCRQMSGPGSVRSWTRPSGRVKPGTGRPAGAPRKFLIPRPGSAPGV
eukprot:3098113-Pyramimonas_sp.AAC.1